MKHNFFGEPVPYGSAELDEALMETDMVVDDTSAWLSFDEEEGEFHGWSAEVREEYTERSFTTLGYESKEQLIADLRTVGIDDIQEY